MASVRKRKMARSSVKKNTRKDKDSQRKIKYIPHPIMKAHWDKKLTWKQNYERFGLQSNLSKTMKRPASETLITQTKTSDEDSNVDPESIATETDPEKIPLGEARLIRDPETNEVVEIIYGKMEKSDEEQPAKAVLPVIDDLIKYQEEHAKPAFVRTLPEQECHWMALLHKKYGDNYERMKWDKKLNPLIWSVGQIKKKMEIWKNMPKEVEP